MNLSSPSASLLPAVLVVDDNSEIRDGLCDFLGLEGFVVRGAVDGVDALQDVALNGLPDVVLLDLNMPRMDGYEFLRRQALDDKMRDVPVIVVSATIIDRSIPYPVAAVFCKPVDLDLLLASVRREAVKRSLR